MKWNAQPKVEMSDYERSTVLSAREVLSRADEIFRDRAELARAGEGGHEISWAGAEGTVTLDVHRHGMSTLVTARTDQLRTSKLDIVVRYLLNQLPYQHGDPPRA
jgi:hypothetical protein